MSHDNKSADKGVNDSADKVLKVQNNALILSYREAQRDIEELKRHNKSLVIDKGLFIKKLNSLQLRYDRRDRRIKDLEEDNRSLRERNTDVVNENIKWYNDLMLMKKMLARSETDDSERADKLRKQVKDIREGVGKILSQLNVMRSESADMNRQCVDLSKENSRIKTIVKKQEKCRKRTTRLKNNVLLLGRIIEDRDRLMALKDARIAKLEDDMRGLRRRLNFFQ